jgi:trehalose/maltose hydrolase-like predicted phosphorylase
LDTRERALEPTADPTWRLEEAGYDPLNEASAESRFAIGNGFLGVRGAREVSRGPTWCSWRPSFTWASWPRTYVAGLFDTPNIEPPVPALAPAADWLRVRIRLNDAPLLIRSGTVLEHRRILDLRRGLLLINWRQHTEAGLAVGVRSLRLVSQADRAIGLQLLQLEIEQGDVAVAVDAAFDQAILGLEPVRIEHSLGVWQTEQSGQRLAMAGAATLSRNVETATADAPGPLSWSWRWTSRAGETAMLQRLVAVTRGNIQGVDCADAAQQALARAQSIGWRATLAAHEAAWAARWQACDVEVDGDDDAQRALRFAAYHLISAANPADEHVSIGARALTGDDYLGHVFWDTEIYLLPFYIFTWPEAARAMLMYRFHTLDGARGKAAQMGWRGAMYAWESAANGTETTPDQVLDASGKAVDVLCGRLEQHITADIAYAVWHYWQATGDDGFLCEAGAEILLETARFWASRAQAEADGRRHIRGVIGPDEYHEDIDDNAYTNRLAIWTLRRAGEVAALLRARWPEAWSRLAGQLGLDVAELALWEKAADTLVTGRTAPSGVLEQFDGFFDLEPVELAAYAGRTALLETVLGRDRIRRSQLCKQADVVALLGLLPGEFDAANAAANFGYYEPRCAHDSSLSRPMHALVAARLGDTGLALGYFRETAATDLSTTGGASAGGVRVAALGGLWQTAIFGFAGVSFSEEAVTLTPRLPQAWRSLGFRLHWRGRRLHLRVLQTPPTVVATLEAGDPMILRVGSTATGLQTDQTVWITSPAP